MSNPDPVQTPANTPPVTGTPTGSNPAGQSTTFTTIRDVSDLQTKAPEVWQAMLQGIAINIIGKMKKSQSRIKEIMRDAYRERR
jgi:hypothetical protein